MADLTWLNTVARLGDLQPWPRNPRQIQAAQAHTHTQQQPTRLT